MKIAFTGGGTLGHVIPALSVYDELVSRYGSFDSFYIGSKKKSEAEYVESHGLRFYPVSTGKLRRYFSLENFTDIFRVCAGFFQSLGILRREKPDVLFSKGGFVSVPVCLAASILGIKLVTHESDCSMGLANRINSRFADIVCLGFDSAAIDGKKYIYTGNPVRHEIVSIAHEDIPVSEDLILVLGGSMGAAEINTLVYENLDALCSRWHVVHQAGKNGDFSIKRDNYDQREFIGDELPLLMKKAKLVITRSGANTVSELCILAKTNLLIPLRSSQSRGDQIENAAWLEERGAAAVLKDGKDFLEKVSVLMDDDTDIGENAYKLRCEDASARIASIIEGVIND